MEKPKEERLYIEEKPRPVRVIVNGLHHAMVGYDVVAGDSWEQFPPAEGSVPILVGGLIKSTDFLLYCTVRWNTKDGQEHRGKIQVTPVLLPPPYKIERELDCE